MKPPGKMKSEVTVEVPLVVTWERIADLLICAFEGGANYWYLIEEFHAPPGDPGGWPVRVDPSAVFRHADFPTNPGGWLVVSDAIGREDGPKDTTHRPTKKRVDRDALLAGLKKWAGANPESFARWYAENEDAEDGDLFLQHVVLGEVVYG